MRRAAANDRCQSDDDGGEREGEEGTWLPIGYSHIFRLYVFGPSGLKDYGSATL